MLLDNKYISSHANFQDDSSSGTCLKQRKLKKGVNLSEFLYEKASCSGKVGVYRFQATITRKVFCPSSWFFACY